MQRGGSQQVTPGATPRDGDRTPNGSAAQIQSSSAGGTPEPGQESQPSSNVITPTPATSRWVYVNDIM